MCNHIQNNYVNIIQNNDFDPELEEKMNKKIQCDNMIKRHMRILGYYRNNKIKKLIAKYDGDKNEILFQLHLERLSINNEDEFETERQRQDYENFLNELFLMDNELFCYDELNTSSTSAEEDEF
jgi:hypothetical protein